MALDITWKSHGNNGKVDLTVKDEVGSVIDCSAINVMSPRTRKQYVNELLHRCKDRQTDLEIPRRVERSQDDRQ